MPTFTKGFRNEPRTEEELREFIRDRIKFSGERNQGFMRVLRKLWRYYLSASPRNAGRRENDRDTGAGPEWRADLFVPASFSVIETAIPRIVFSILGSLPFLKLFVPK